MRILMHIPGRHDATNWYRGTGPLSALRKTHSKDIILDFAQEVSFSTAQTYDLAFFQRPSTKSELEAIRIFRRLGIPVIVDYDDLLFDIPTDNPSHAAYMNRETQESIIAITREASCVWVSTKELKRCLQIPKAPLNDRVYVVPNALDDTHMLINGKSSPPPVEKRQPAVLWRGSHTHHRDVMEFTPEIGDVAERFRQWSFVFAGWNPWFLTDRMPDAQAIVSGALPVGEFMDFVYATAPQIGIVPLHDSRFNRCKSNIAWLEMTWAGAACLVPEWEEWRHPGATTYETHEDFRIGLASLIESTPERRAELNAMAWEHVRKNFLLSTTNEVRAATIKAAVNKWPIEEWPNGWQRLEDPDVVMDLQ